MSNMDGKNSKVFLFWLCVKQNIYINNVEQYFILMGQLGEKIYNNSLTSECQYYRNMELSRNVLDI